MTRCRKGLFVDLDGTCADSLTVMREVYERFLRACGRVGTDSEFARLNGPPLVEVVTALKHGHGLDGTTDELLRRYRAYVDEAYEHVRPMPGTERLLRAASGQGWTTAIVTSNSTLLTRRWLAAHNLEGDVFAVIGGEFGGRGKPHPDPYLAALAQCGCLAEQSLAVEDSRQGARAAMGAGLATYVVGRDGRDASGWPPVAGFVDSLDQIIGLL